MGRARLSRCRCFCFCRCRCCCSWLLRCTPNVQFSSFSLHAPCPARQGCSVPRFLKSTPGTERSRECCTGHDSVGEAGTPRQAERRAGMNPSAGSCATLHWDRQSRLGIADPKGLALTGKRAVQYPACWVRGPMLAWHVLARAGVIWTESLQRACVRGVQRNSCRCRRRGCCRGFCRCRCLRRAWEGKVVVFAVVSALAVAFAVAVAANGGQGQG